MTMVDEQALQAYAGKQLTLEDELHPFPASALAAALNRDSLPGRGDVLPPGWQWLYFLDTPARLGHGRRRARD